MFLTLMLKIKKVSKLVPTVFLLITQEPNKSVEDI